MAAADGNPSAVPALEGGEKGEKKKARVPRPKLEAATVLHASRGIRGYVHAKMPAYFRKAAKGKGHEAGDLGRLLGLYERWQTKCFPYGDFDGFVKKLDKVGTAFEVRQTVRNMRDDAVEKRLGTKAARTGDDDVGDELADVDFEALFDDEVREKPTAAEDDDVRDELADIDAEAAFDDGARTKPTSAEDDDEALHDELADMLFDA